MSKTHTWPQTVATFGSLCPDGRTPTSSRPQLARMTQTDRNNCPKSPQPSRASMHQHTGRPDPRRQDIRGQGPPRPPAEACGPIQSSKRTRSLGGGHGGHGEFGRRWAPSLPGTRPLTQQGGRFLLCRGCRTLPPPTSTAHQPFEPDVPLRCDGRKRYGCFLWPAEIHCTSCHPQ